MGGHGTLGDKTGDSNQFSELSMLCVSRSVSLYLLLALPVKSPLSNNSPARMRPMSVLPISWQPLRICVTSALRNGTGLSVNTQSRFVFVIPTNPSMPMSVSLLGKSKELTELGIPEYERRYNSPAKRFSCRISLRVAAQPTGSAGMVYIVRSSIDRNVRFGRGAYMWIATARLWRMSGKSLLTSHGLKPPYAQLGCHLLLP